MSIYDTYTERLNAMLENDGFKERFIKSIVNQKNKSVELLHLEHPNLVSKQINIFEEKGVYVVSFLSVYTKITKALNEDVDIANLYEYVKQILRDEVITITAYDKNDNPLGSGSIAKLFDLNSIEYTDKEREFLKKPGNRFNSWSGNVSEQDRLLLIGAFVTKSLQIKQAYNNYYIEQSKLARKAWMEENDIIWMGAPSKFSILYSLKIVLPLFLAFFLLSLFALFESLWLFLFFSAVIIVSLLISVIGLFWRVNRTKYIIDKITINSINAKIHIYENFENITEVKLKMSIFGKKDKLGTIKIKTNKMNIFLPRCHLLYISNADEVYKLINDQINTIKANKTE